MKIEPSTTPHPLLQISNPRQPLFEQMHKYARDPVPILMYLVLLLFTDERPFINYEEHRLLPFQFR